MSSDYDSAHQKSSKKYSLVPGSKKCWPVLSLPKLQLKKLNGKQKGILEDLTNRIIWKALEMLIDRSL